MRFHKRRHASVFDAIVAAAPLIIHYLQIMPPLTVAQLNGFRKREAVPVPLDLSSASGFDAHKGESVFEGYYLTTEMRTLNDGSRRTVHTFAGDTGHVAIWGFVALDMAIQGTIAGTKVRLIYYGKKQRPDGKTEHLVDVYENPKDTISL